MTTASVLGQNIDDEIAAKFEAFDQHPDTQQELHDDLVVDKQQARLQAERTAANAAAAANEEPDEIPFKALPGQGAEEEEPTETDEAAAVEAGAEADETAEAGEEEQINTLSELAAVYDVDPTEFAEHLQIEGPDGEMHSLQDAISTFQTGPAENEAVEAGIAAHIAETRKEIDVHMQKMVDTTKGLLVRIQQEEQIDWDALKEQDIHAYVARREKFDEDRAAAQAAFDAFDEEEQRRAKEDERLQEQDRSEQARLIIRRMPAWRDQDVAKVATSDMRHAMKANGFTDEEFDNLSDARQIIMVWKAAQFDKLQEKIKKPGALKRLRGIPTRKSLAATARRDAPAPDSAAKQKRQGLVDGLRQSGSIDDAAALFTELS